MAQKGESKKRCSTATDHPCHSNGPAGHEDDGEHTGTRAVTGGDVVELGHLVVGAVGAGVGVTLGYTTGVGREGCLVLEGDQDGIENTEDGHLLFQSVGAVPGLRVPLNTAVRAIRKTGAGLDGGLGRGLQLGHDEVVGPRDNGGHESEPGGEVGLEGDLIAITLLDRFASNLRQNISAATGWVELIGGANQTCNAILPFLGSVGL